MEIKQNGFLMPPHPFTNFEIQKYYQNEPRFNDVYSRDNFNKRSSTECNSFEIKGGAYVVNLIWVLWYCNLLHSLYVQNNVTYFDSFGVEYIPKEIRKFINNKNIKTNIFRIQEYDSITCGYFCIGFIGYMFEGKNLTNFMNLFSPHNYKKWWYNFKIFDDKCLKMAECNSVGYDFHETPNIYPNKWSTTV